MTSQLGDRDRQGRRARRRALPLALAWAGLLFAAAAFAGELPEYRLKTAFLYNFALFTEWPAEVGGTLNLCILGQDPFGADIDELNGKAAGARVIAVQRRAASDPLSGCHLVFVTSSVIARLPRILEAVRGQPVLTVADSPGAGGQGVIVNMAVAQNRITFEVDLRAARTARLNLSSKLLRLATEVHQ